MRTLSTTELSTISGNGGCYEPAPKCEPKKADACCKS